MEKVVLKLGKKDILECIAKNFPLGSFYVPCNGPNALSPKDSAVNGCSIHYCEYASFCNRLRRKVNGR